MDIIKYIETLPKRIYEKYFYLNLWMIAIFVCVALVLPSYIASNGAISKQVILVTLLTIFAVTLLIHLVVTCFRRLPKFKDDETGIIFVIQTNSSDEREVVNNRFVKKIAQVFNEEFYQRSNIKLLDPFNTGKFIDSSLDRKKQIIKDTNAKLVIWGTLEKEKTQGKDAYFMKLNSGVAHSAISVNVSRMLSSNMTQAMQPIREICVFDEESKLGFDLAVNATELIAQYIMGEACYFSGNLHRAVDIFGSLQRSLNRNKRNVNYIALLKHVSKTRMTDLYTLISCEYYNDFRKAGDYKKLDEMKKCLDKVLEYGGASTLYYEQMALYYFCNGRNVERARKCVEECFKNGNKSIIAMYDRAFLKLYSKYSPYVAYNCYTEYMAIFKKNKNLDLIEDIEDFISWIIDEEPEKVRLNWLLALLANEREDFDLSNQYLDRFLEEYSEGLNSELKDGVESLKCHNGNKEPMV